MRVTLYGVMICLAASAHAQRMEPNSFLLRPAPTHAALAKQVGSEPVVMKRYVKHFEITPAEVRTFVGTLKHKKLTHSRKYTIWFALKNGTIRSRKMTLKRGTKVWIDAAGKPALKASCGNPLLKKPLLPRGGGGGGTPSQSDTPLEITKNPMSELQLTPSSSELLPMDIPLNTVVSPPILTPLPPSFTMPSLVAPYPTIAAAGSGISPWLAGGILAAPFLIFDGRGSERSTPPPVVSESKSVLAFGLGVGALAISMRRRHKKARKIAASGV